MFTAQNILLFLSVMLSALMMGLLYAYACSVNPGLHALPDNAYISAMQSINTAIQNPFFFISFMGTILILPLTTWYSRQHASPACFYFLLAATLIYLVGVIGVTAFGNIPLNNALAKFDIANSPAEAIAKQRALFESSWNNYHLIRTIASILATACTVAAVIKK